MRVVYVVGDGPLQGATYAIDGRLPLNTELELNWEDWPTAVYRVGAGCKLWFIHLLPESP